MTSHCDITHSVTHCDIPLWNHAQCHILRHHALCHTHSAITKFHTYTHSVTHTSPHTQCHMHSVTCTVPYTQCHTHSATIEAIDIFFSSCPAPFSEVALQPLIIIDLSTPVITNTRKDFRHRIRNASRVYAIVSCLHSLYMRRNMRIEGN